MKTALLLFLSCAQLLQLGCKPAPASSFEVVSPTREFNAEVEMFDNGGLVSPGVNVTFVYLHRGTDPKLPVLILSGGPPQGPVPVLKWITPMQLDISYNDQQTIKFQAVQFDGVFVVTTAGHL